MKKLLLIGLWLLGFTAPLRADIAGSGDHPLVPRYPGSEIKTFQVKEYDEYMMAIGPRVGGVIESATLEGKITRIFYMLSPTERSTLEVMRNYEQALAENGFQTLFKCGNRETCGISFPYDIRRKVNKMSIEASVEDMRYLAVKLTRPDQGDVTIAIAVQRYRYPPTNEMAVIVAVDIIEAEGMDVGMELVLADEMFRDLSAEGRTVLYGILFEYDSASIKAESAETIAEIARLLQENPQLNLLVVGHTDNQGDLKYNVDLSQRRAVSVVQSLTGQHGIAASRLSAHGVGYLAPAATNDSEAGREKNRRVELVKR